MNTVEDQIPKERRWPLLVVSGLILLVLAFVAWDQRPWADSRGGDDLGMRADHTPRPGEEAPDFVLENERGERVALSDFQGRPVFLNFWATWCTFCIDEMPDMQRVQEQYADDLVVIGVNAGDSIEDGEEFVARTGVKYVRLYDRDLEVTDGYLVQAMPTSYFITADGLVLDANFGYMTYDDMLDRVEALISANLEGRR
ncbi:MAG TPA: redoxin domain-containing protein [Thermomicrobiales bacterium]|nr:redoxin domain-containing protein [Thermomicrobiales bacterium]